MKVLVTGTAGFIGYHVAKRLVSRGDIVVGLDSISNYYDVNIKYDRLSKDGFDKSRISYNVITQSCTYPNYSFIQLKLEDKTNLDILFAEQKFDVVVNLAAQAGVRYSISNPQAYID
ncbi:MAG TPA: GDP-mannose 4,6-dehydratase, partial [Segetibacter sp.]